MRPIIMLTLVLIGLLWTFGLATLTVVNYFTALFNDYQVLVTINQYGEYVYETPLVILACPVMLFSTVFCLRLVAGKVRSIELPLKTHSMRDVKPGIELGELEWSKEST